MAAIERDDGLPHSLCDPCSQRLDEFDFYAKQCSKVQNMFGAVLKQGGSKAENIRKKYLNHFDKAVCINNIETFSSEKDLLDSSENIIKRKFSRRRSIRMRVSPVIHKEIKKRSKSVCKRNRKDRKEESDSEERASEEQCDYELTSIEREAISVNGQLNIKSEVREKEISEDLKISDTEITKKSEELQVSRKRGRYRKALVGAAKRKAKIPRIVKPEPDELTNEALQDITFDQTNGSVETDQNKVDYKESISETDASTNDNNEDNYNIKTDIYKKKKSSENTIFRWECHVCGEMCSNWNSLSIHCRKLHGEPAHVVCLCAKVLASRASIIKHRLKHTDGYKYKCDKCEKSFHRRALFDVHLLSHVPKEEQPFVCCKCARRFHCEALLRQHERIHLPREERLTNPCDICGKKFSSKSAVSAHLKAVHFGERPFVCDQCGHSFTSKGILQEHLTIHSDETPFKCTKCRKSFKTKYRLKIHTDTHRETPYQCPVCPLKLNTRRTLRMHLVVHKDIKAYQCATCGKAFRRAKDLNNHHNLHTGRRPYTCTFCPRTFANGSNCRSHKRRMHPEELRIYEANLAAAENGNSTSYSEETMQNVPNNISSREMHQSLPSDESNSILLQDPVASEIKTSVSLSNSSFQEQSLDDDNFLSDPLVSKSSIYNSLALRNGNNTIVSTPHSSHSDFRTSTAGHPTACYGLVNHMNINSDVISRTQNIGIHISPVSLSMIQRSTHQIRNHISPDESESSAGNINKRNLSSETLLQADQLHSSSPLNLNISELDASRQHDALSNIDESRRRTLDNFHTGTVGVQRHNLSSINTNLHQLHRHHQHHHTLCDRDILLTQRDMNVSGTNIYHSQHTNPEQASILHDFSASLNHLYQHQSTNMSSAVAVPAFPGNPYIHHNMGYGRNNANI